MQTPGLSNKGGGESLPSIGDRLDNDSVYEVIYLHCCSIYKTCPEAHMCDKHTAVLLPLDSEESKLRYACWVLKN